MQVNLGNFKMRGSTVEKGLRNVKRRLISDLTFPCIKVAAKVVDSSFCVNFLRCCIIIII